MIGLLLFFLLAIPLSGEETSQERDFLSLIGMEPAEAIDILGAPLEIYPYRGNKDWQDNVIFYYSDRLYLFWYKNRVWQIRLDGEYAGSIFDFSMGDEREKILHLKGEPHARDDRSFIYFLPDQGYPVKMRLFFEDNRLSDLYLYRGDF